MLKAIIFDLDNTLLWDDKSVSEAFKATCAIAEQKYEVDAAALADSVKKHARKLYAAYDFYPFTQMIGINPFEGLWGDFDDAGEEFQQMHKQIAGYRKDAWTSGLRDMEIDDAVFGEKLADTFQEERQNHAYLYADTLKTLDALKGKYPLVMLTNGSPSLQQTKLSLSPELKPYFDHIIISGAFGKGKPDPSIFEHVLELLEVEAEEALMVGDNLSTDILGASRTGIENVWINRKQAKPPHKVSPTYEVNELHEILSIIE